MFSFIFDKNGNYVLNGKRFLVNFIRGALIAEPNPLYVIDHKRKIYNLRVPALIEKYYKGPVGCVCAVVVDGKVKYGYSHVNVGEDKFCKKTAVEMALERAFNSDINPLNNNCRWNIQGPLEEMYYRSRAYFKYLNVIE